MVSQAALIALFVFGLVNGQLGHTYVKQFSQEFKDGYNTLKYVGGNGPYTDGTSLGINRNPPPHCEVDQVISLMRHGERYPDPSVAKGMLESLDKILNSGIKSFHGSLSFLNT